MNFSQLFSSIVCGFLLVVFFVRRYLLKVLPLAIIFIVPEIAFSSLIPFYNEPRNVCDREDEYGVKNKQLQPDNNHYNGSAQILNYGYYYKEYLNETTAFQNQYDTTNKDGIYEIYQKSIDELKLPDTPGADVFPPKSLESILLYQKIKFPKIMKELHFCSSNFIIDASRLKSLSILLSCAPPFIPMSMAYELLGGNIDLDDDLCLPQSLFAFDSSITMAQLLVLNVPVLSALDASEQQEVLWWLANYWLLYFAKRETFYFSKKNLSDFNFIDEDSFLSEAPETLHHESVQSYIQTIKSSIDYGHKAVTDQNSQEVFELTLLSPGKATAEKAKSLPVKNEPLNLDRVENIKELFTNRKGERRYALSAAKDKLTALKDKEFLIFKAGFFGERFFIVTKKADMYYIITPYNRYLFTPSIEKTIRTLKEIVENGHPSFNKNLDIWAVSLFMIFASYLTCSECKQQGNVSSYSFISLAGILFYLAEIKIQPDGIIDDIQ